MFIIESGKKCKQLSSTRVLAFNGYLNYNTEVLIQCAVIFKTIVCDVVIACFILLDFSNVGLLHIEVSRIKCFTGQY